MLKQYDESHPQHRKHSELFWVVNYFPSFFFPEEINSKWCSTLYGELLHFRRAVESSVRVGFLRVWESCFLRLSAPSCQVPPISKIGSAMALGVLWIQGQGSQLWELLTCKALEMINLLGQTVSGTPAGQMSSHTWGKLFYKLVQC